MTERPDHMAAAKSALLTPGQWVSVGTYPSETDAVQAVRKVRAGAMTAYTPAGAFDATVRQGDVIQLVIRYVGGTPTKPLAGDQRPISQVARLRTHSSTDPHRFVAELRAALTEWRDGADLATASMDYRDPVRLAAQIEALAGLRRLAATKEATQ